MPMKARFYHVIKALQVFTLGCLIEIRRKQFGWMIDANKNFSSESTIRANESMSRLGNKWMELRQAIERDKEKDFVIDG